MGAIYTAMKRRGYERHERTAILSEAGFSYPQRTLDHYARQIDTGSVPVPSPGTAGRKRALTPEEERIFCGWVLGETKK